MRGLTGVLGLVTASLVFPTHAQSTLDRPVGTEQPDHLDSGTLANTAGIATQVFGRTVRVGGAAGFANDVPASASSVDSIPPAAGDDNAAEFTTLSVSCVVAVSNRTR